MNALEDSASQVAAVAAYLDRLNERMDHIPARTRDADAVQTTVTPSVSITPTPDRTEVAL